MTWTLPKGTPEPRRDARADGDPRGRARRPGLEVRITGPLDSIEYWFVQRGTRIHKTVHYFLMEPTGGDLDRHDHEFEEVRWISFAEAQHLLTFETERALVARAAAADRRRPADAAGRPGPPARERPPGQGA